VQWLPPRRQCRLLSAANLSDRRPVLVGASLGGLALLLRCASGYNAYNTQQTMRIMRRRATNSQHISQRCATYNVQPETCCHDAVSSVAMRRISTTVFQQHATDMGAVRRSCMRELWYLSTSARTWRAQACRYTHTRAHTHPPTRTRAHSHPSTRTHARTHIHPHARARTHIHLPAHTRAHTRTQMHKHPRTHARTRASVCAQRAD
jgi:hypothetical protein